VVRVDNASEQIRMTRTFFGLQSEDDSLAA
jgi:hypothetical protein